MVFNGTNFATCHWPMHVEFPGRNPAFPVSKNSGSTAPAQKGGGLPWVHTRPGHGYFVTDQGHSWMPIGQNDAITWPELRGVFRRRDMATAAAYFAQLARHGINCVRLMLEYCQHEHRYFEQPVGQFAPNMVRLWDDLFALAENYGIRFLLTPYDTFWMRVRWQYHPYNRKAAGGICGKRGEWLLCKHTRAAIKHRLAFVTERWGGSGALFAWDLWNEIHPTHAGNSVAVFSNFISDVGGFLRETELRLHGRAHPQTVSVFGPVLKSHPGSAEAVYRHPALDFASIHFYERNTIDHPRNTVTAAISAGRLTRDALAGIADGRPFFDSEHGPIHAFRSKKITLPQPFDDEYFRHMQWAHLASGGAGGGMRWPYRHPHSLTPGMRKAQQGLAGFLPLIDWLRFARTNWNDQIKISNKALVPFGCGDDRQAVCYLLRRDSIGKDGMLRMDLPPAEGNMYLPLYGAGRYILTAWDTRNGKALATADLAHAGGSELCVPLPPIATDMAFAVVRQ